MSEHICFHTKLAAIKYALWYLCMKKSSYAKVAEKFKVPQKDIESALKITLPKFAPRLAVRVTAKAAKNSARALSEIHAKQKNKS